MDDLYPNKSELDPSYSAPEPSFHQPGVGYVPIPPSASPTSVESQPSRYLSSNPTNPKMAAAAMGAAAGGAGSTMGSIYGGLFNIGSSLINKSSSIEQAKIYSAPGMAQVDLNRDLANRQWDAAKSAGLYSPSQFESGASDYYSFVGGNVAKVKRTSGPSPYNNKFIT